MAAFKDRRGRWRYRIVVRLLSGARRRICGTPSLDTREEAMSAERAHIERLLHPERFAAARPTSPLYSAFPPHFSSFAMRWRASRPVAAGNRASTIAEKDSVLRVHLLPAFGETLIGRIDGESIERFAAGLRAGGRSEKTCRNVLSVLRQILQAAVDWGVLDRAPPTPATRTITPEWDWYTRGESDGLISHAEGQDRAMLLFALHTGARAGEQIAIEWGDLDFERGLVGFRRASSRGEVGPTKSGKPRWVPMTMALRGALLAHRHLRGPLVFCREDGSPLTHALLDGILQRGARRAGLRLIRWHDLRHSYASQLVSAGVPVPRVQQLLGHASINMTMRYAHLAPSTGSAEIAALEGIAV